MGFSGALAMEQKPFGANSLELFFTTILDTMPSEFKVL
jgi:hypothetical protein